MPVDETSLRASLEASYPNATHIQVWDISGGCGASYEVLIVSASFEGKTTLKRHREGTSSPLNNAPLKTNGLSSIRELTITGECQLLPADRIPVNEKLKSAIAELHAFTQRTLTPKQYEQQVQAETNAA